MDEQMFEQARAKAEAAGLRDQLVLARATRVQALHLARACRQGLVTNRERVTETRVLQALLRGDAPAWGNTARGVAMTAGAISREILE